MIGESLTIKIDTTHKILKGQVLYLQYIYITIVMCAFEQYVGINTRRRFIYKKKTSIKVLTVD